MSMWELIEAAVGGRPDGDSDYVVAKDTV